MMQKGIVLYTEYRQCTKLSLQSSELGIPHPLIHRRVCVYPPPGEAHWLAREGGVPIPPRGQRLWYSWYICNLWFYTSVDL
jgi:hypothetical protein